MKQLILSALLLLSFVQATYACSCVYIETFCETITFGQTGINPSYLIIHGRVKTVSSESMDVQVLDVLFGQTTQSVFTIMSGDGADCRMFVGGFLKGGEYIFAFSGTAEHGYHLFECGRTWLEIQGKNIRGPIAPGISHIAISDFHTVAACDGIGSTISTISVTPTLSAGGVIQIASTTDIQGIRIAMYDMVGRLMYTHPSDELSGTALLELPTYRYPAGAYVIVAETAAVRRVFRVVIVS